MYKIILVIALICAQEASSQQIIGNPFSPDDDLMTTFEKASTKKVDSQVVSTVKKPVVKERKKDTVAVAIIKSPVTVKAKSESAVKIEESIPEVEYIQPTVKKKAITEDVFENSGLMIQCKKVKQWLYYLSLLLGEKKYLLYKTVIQNKPLSGQRMMTAIRVAISYLRRGGIKT